MSACYLRKVILLLCTCAWLLDYEARAQNKGMLLKDALKKVTKVYGTVFVYDPQLLEGKTTAYEVTKNDKPLDDVLKSILYPSNLVFLYIKNNYYSIASKDRFIEAQNGLNASGNNINSSPPPSGEQKQITVSGTVRDAKGTALPRVTITEEGTNNTTLTNDEGNFRITVKGRGASLQFSSIGFSSTKVTVADNQPAVNIILESTESAIDDVVVVAYGTMKKSDLTGASSAIKGSELVKVPVQTAAEALTGKVAGVQVQRTDGQPGADILIQIRGGTSISQDNSPLYIIDGFPSERGLSQISPQDIERIDILKDASSTAIYGARGANGVILITTKAGKIGTGLVTYDGYVGFKKFKKELDVLSPYEYVVYQYERTRGNSVSMDKFLQNYGTWDSLIYYKDKPGVDWQNEAFGGNHLYQSHNVGLSGGSQNTQYRVSFSHDDEDGLLVANNYSRNFFKIRLDQKVTSRLSLSTNMMFAQSEIGGAGTAGSQDNGRLKNAVMYRPTNGLRGTDASLTEQDYDPDVSLTNINTQAQAQQRHRTNRNTVMNVSLDYILAKGLTFRTLGGLTLDADRSESFDTEKSSDAAAAGGPFGGIEFSNTDKYSNTNLLIYQTTFKKKHQINATLGEELVYNKYKFVGSYASMFDNSTIGINNLALGNQTPKPASRVESDKLLSYFGRVFYSFNSKYLLTATLRADGSSKFIQQNRWGYFPSIAVAWQAGRENFIKDLNLFSDLKVRLSYGVAGNNRIANNRYSSAFTNAVYAANGTSLSVGLIPSSIANPSLKWEATYSQNLGFDFGFLKNRITATVDIYHNNTKDLLLNAAIPTSSGYTTQYKNIGSTTGKGVEITLTTTNIKSPKFNWTSGLNISFFKNKVTSLNNDGGFQQQSFLTPSNYAINIYDYLVKVGEPVGLIYGYVTDGFYGVDDFNYNPVTKTYTLKDGIPAITRSTTQPGDIKFKDLGGVKDASGNPTITDDDDRTIIGHTTPKFFGGFTNTFSYKGIDLSIFANFSVGNQILNANKIVYTTAYSDYSNVLGIERNRWMTVNAKGEVVTDPTELKELNKNATLWKWMGGLPRWTHSWAVEDGSFLRINTVTIGYTLPKSMLQRIHTKGMRIYATANNVYTFTNYTGFDPEINTRRSSPFTPGVDYSGFPRSFAGIIGLNLTF